MNKTNITALLCTTAFLMPMIPQIITNAEGLNIGDVVGQTVATDIMTYVNGEKIPAYSTNGETLDSTVNSTNCPIYFLISIRPFYTKICPEINYFKTSAQ